MATLTIPGTSAYHVVGEISTELAHGDLTVIVSTASLPDTAGRHPILVLTVAQAAFQIYEDTVFGTVDGDERVYVFKPDLGEGVSGYVKLVLPDGVIEAGSEFSALQERFEEILVGRGLLNEGESTPPAESITIHSAVASHVLGETEVDLARGDLTLSSVAPAHSTDSTPVLVLTVGHAAFPLHPTTIFGTIADDELVYVFKPEVEDGSLPAGGYVKVTLPDKSNGLTDELQEKFEQLLIDHGLLKTGVLAAGDEITRGVDEDATSAANYIRKSTENFLAKHPPTDTPLTSSTTTHTLTESASSATTTLYQAAQSVSSVFSAAASSAGAFLSSRLAGGPPTAETKELTHAAGDIYSSARSDATVVKNTVSNSVGDVTEQQLGRKTGQAEGNAVGAIGDAVGTSGQVPEVGTGAALVTGSIRGVEGATDASQSSAEMNRFTIEEKEDNDSEEWKDVAV